MKTRPPLPSRFSAYLGGCFSVSYDIELRGDALLVNDGKRPTLVSTEVHPSLEAWVEFKRALDSINVWCWRSEYPNPGILDGTQWSLDIDYPDRSVQAHGDNNYPGPEGMPTGQPEEPDTFQSFVGAVSKLLGKEPSQ